MTTATDFEGLLQAGIAAYKQGNYDQAIASLSKLSRSPSRSYRLKAAMGMIRTYVAQEDWKKADALCQKLAKSSKPSVQQWSKTMLQTITPNLPVVSSVESQPSSSGFQPLTADEAPKADRIKASFQDSMFHYTALNGDDEAVDDADLQPSSSSTQETLRNRPSEYRQPALVNRTEAVAPELSKPDETDAAYVWPETTARLKQGRRLGKMKRTQLQIAQLGGVIAFYFLFRYLLLNSISFINEPLIFLDNRLPFWVRQIPLDVRALSWQLLALFVLITVASPWLWDLWLKFTTNRQPFSNQKLRAHSPEAAALLAKCCQKKSWPFPTLWKLPTDVPLIFSYGWLPRNARLVVSDGLIAALDADELAALVAYELAHWKSGYWILLSLHGLIQQLFHQLYWQLSIWGNRQPNYLKWPAGIFANVSYVVFWSLRFPVLWISRLRTYYGDRTAAETTGNPNGLAKALTQLSFACAVSIEHQGYTPPILERTALLLPIAPDLTRYKLYGQAPVGPLFAWDAIHPLRGWMSLTAGHPPLGDRLRLLMAYAQHWKLEKAIQLPTLPRHRQKGLTLATWTLLMKQSTPYVGLVIGLSLGCILWVVGAIAHQAQWPALDWMHQDTGLFRCCWLLGLSVGILLRINRFFPDLSMQMQPTQDIAQQMSDPNLTPLSSMPTRLSGTLIGRPGLANWLGQDLLLKTNHGLHKLHYFSAIGPLGNVIGIGEKPPATIIGESVQVLAWLRRSPQSWLDVDKIRLQNGQLIQAAHPIFSLIIAASASALGLWLLIQGYN